MSLITDLTNISATTTSSATTTFASTSTDSSTTQSTITDSTTPSTTRKMLIVTRSYYLISGSNDTTVKLWYLNNGTLRATFTGHTKSVTCVINVGNGILASGSADNTIRIWSMNNMSFLFAFNSSNGGHTDVVTSLVKISISLIASASWDNSVKVWNLTSYALKFTFDSNNGGHINKVNCLCFMKNGQLASGSSDFTVKLWDLTSGSLNYSFDILHDGYSSSIIQILSFSSDILVANANMAMLKTWNLNHTYMPLLLSSINGKTGLFNAIAATDNSYLVTGLSSGGIKVWDLSLSVANFTFDGAYSYNSSVDLLCAITGGLFAAANGLNEIRIFDTSFGLSMYNLVGHSSKISAMVLANNGNLVSGSLDNSIRVWDVGAGVVKYVFNNTNGGHTGSINSFAVI